MSVVTVAGDRQSGRTATLLAIALDEAGDGRRVVFETHHRVDATEAFLRAVKKVESRGDIHRIRHAAGDEHIVFNSGGKIMFVATASGGSRGLTADIHILDGSDADRLVTAGRLYRSVHNSDLYADSE